VTFTPGTTAPVESVTVPRIVAVILCANEGTAGTARTAIRTTVVLRMAETSGGLVRLFYEANLAREGVFLSRFFCCSGIGRARHGLTWQWLGRCGARQQAPRQHDTAQGRVGDGVERPGVFQGPLPQHGLQERARLASSVGGLGGPVQRAHGDLVSAALVAEDGPPSPDPHRASVPRAPEADRAGAAHERHSPSVRGPG